MSQSPYSNPNGDSIKTFPLVQGINQDVTKFLSPSWVEGQHTRFDNGQPRKMGGFERIIPGNTDIIRGSYVVAIENKKRIFLFRNSGIWQVDVLQDGTVVGEVNRTPSGWNTPGAGDPDLYFSMAEYTKTIVKDNTFITNSYLYVVGLPMTENIYNTQEAPVFFGDISGSDNFLPYEATVSDSLPPVQLYTSGGIFVESNRILLFGNNGIIRFSEEGDPTDMPLVNFDGRGSQKFIAARPGRTGFLLWSPTTLYNASFNAEGKLEIVVLSPALSIISPASIIDGYNNTYFWVGKKQFFSFTGVLNTFKNNFNRNFIFENLNPSYQGKIWGMFAENFTELWWFFPLKGETECSTLIKMNLEEQSWSKTTLNRAAGVQGQIFDDPILSSNITNEYSQISTNYPLWYQERGYDMVVGNETYAISAWIQTNMMCLYREEQSLNFSIRLRRWEKDINQSGDMQLEIMKYEYPNSSPVVSNPIIFSATDTNVPIDEEASIFSLRFTSNVAGGFYQFGKMYLDFQYGNPRPTSEEESG